MSNPKQKLAEMVLQKMKEKKQAEQRNRPHYELLQLNVQFSLQQNQSLKQQINNLNEILKRQSTDLNMLKQNLQELQNTGKKTYPVIIIKPQFIASENIPSAFKEFYRKTANTFLKADLIKSQKYEIYMQKEKEINKIVQQISSLETQNNQLITLNTKTLQQKRSRVLKEDVKRRLLIQEQNKIDQQTQRLRSQNQKLLRQYEIKKENLQNRIKYSEEIAIKIQDQKKKIEVHYNPITYRQYLKQVFNVRIKNQQMQNNLLEVIRILNQAKKNSQKCKGSLEKKFSIKFIGRTFDSPSKIKGKIQKSLQKQTQIRSKTNPKNLTQMIDIKSTTERSSIKHKRFNSMYSQYVQNDERCLSLFKKKSHHSSKNYSSLKMLKTMKSSLKSDRTMSTTLALSSAKKRYQDF